MKKMGKWEKAVGELWERIPKSTKLEKEKNGKNQSTHETPKMVFSPKWGKCQKRHFLGKWGKC